jgi:hypothetical protein
MSVKNSSDTIGNRTRDVPVCSAVPQQSSAVRQLRNYVTSLRVISVKLPREIYVHLLILTEESVVDLGSCLRWGKPTVPCL